MPSEYNAIDPAHLQVGAKPRASVVQALDENLHAMFEGAAGAPRLQNDAIENAAIGAAKMQSTNAESVWVGQRMAALGGGNVGSFAFLSRDGYIAVGSTHAGGSLRWAGITPSGVYSASAEPVGTWVALGAAGNPADVGTFATLFQRIS